MQPAAYSCRMDVLPEDSPLYPIAAKIVEAIENKQREFRRVAQMEDNEASEILRDVVAAALQAEILDGRLHLGPGS